MDVNDKKRPRSQNWDEVEKAILLDHVKEELHVVENKKKLNIYNKDKFAAWERIRQKMNVEGYPRDVKRIREQWQRMKIQAKRSISMHKDSIKQTGGGPPIPEPTEIEWKIKDLLPCEFTKDTSSFDSDVNKNVPIATEFPTASIESSTPKHDDIYEDHSYTTFTQSCPSIIAEVEIENILEGEAAEFETEEEIITANVDVGASVSNAHTNRRKVKRKNMTEYEEKLFELNEKRISQMMRHEEEIHKIKMKKKKRIMRKK